MQTSAANIYSRREFFGLGNTTVPWTLHNYFKKNPFSENMKIYINTHTDINTDTDICIYIHT